MQSFNQQENVAKIGALCACFVEYYDVLIVALIMMEFISIVFHDVRSIDLIDGVLSLHDWEGYG